MSGLFGIVNYRGAIDDLPEQMGAALQHLEHHQLEIAHVSAQMAIGRQHIGILNQSMQPVVSLDGDVHCWLCGELYYQSSGSQHTNGATPDNDVERVLQVYMHQGVKGLTELQGAFLIAIWDARHQELILVNDRFGLYPHYYAHTNSLFAFAAEMKALLRVPAIPRRLSDVALAEYIRFQQLLGQKTWFEDIQLLPPASILRYRPRVDQLRLERYWHFSEIRENKQISFDEAVEEAGRLFVRAVDARSSGPERLGIYLSGGLDGRMILGASMGKHQLRTITFGHPQCRDVIYAARLAARAGSTHSYFPLTDGRWVREYAPLHLALTEGMHCWMHAHGISTYAQSRQLIDVNLSGWEGEMTLGGLAIAQDYEQDRYYRQASGEIDFAQNMYEAFCYHMTWPGLNEAEALSLFSGRGAARMRSLAFESMVAEVARTRNYPKNRRLDYFALEQHALRPLQQQIVIGRAWLEVRCPFFDYDFLSFIFSLPLAIHTHPQFRHSIITRHMRPLTSIPNERDERLPDSRWFVREPHATFQRVKGVVNRRIAAFFPQRSRLYADYEDYLRGDLRSWAEAILFNSHSLERGIVDPEAVRALWRRHCSGKELWTIGKLAPLISLELVLRELYDSSRTYAKSVF